MSSNCISTKNVLAYLKKFLLEDKCREMKEKCGEGGKHLKQEIFAKLDLI